MMKISSFAQVCLGTLIAAGAVAIACGGDNNPSSGSSGSTGSTTSGTASGTSTTSGNGTSGTASGATAGSSGTAGATGAAGTGSGAAGAATGATGTATGTTGTATGTTGTASGASSGAVSDAGAGGVCPSTLQDKTTPCTMGVDMPCAKGCGPDLPAASAQKNLGEKTCTCGTAGVYTCSACVYENPLPGCYMAAVTPPTCAVGVADKGTCTTPCSGAGTGNDVCQITTDAGKAQGCVCVTGSNGPVWTCATLPW